MRCASSRRSPFSTDTSIDTSQLIGLAVPIVETRCCPKACGFSDWYPSNAAGTRDQSPDPANPMYGSGSRQWQWTYGPGRQK
jgi:hypothetical protein